MPLLQILFIAAILLATAVSALLAGRDHNDTSVPDATQILASEYQKQFNKLFNVTPVTDSRHAHGYQKWDMCCIKVVQSLVDVDIKQGDLRLKEHKNGTDGKPFYTGTKDSMLEELLEYSQFPCDATANDHADGWGPGPNFWTPYYWCEKECPGWEWTPIKEYQLWLRPIVMFILPALVFCLIIPRRRRLALPEHFITGFLPSIPRFLQPVVLGVELVLAAFIAAVDTLIWLTVSFSIAGPMLISGTYEAMLDARVLRLLEESAEKSPLTVRDRALALLTVLVGNLDTTPAWRDAVEFVSRYSGETQVEHRGTQTIPPSSPNAGSEPVQPAEEDGSQDVGETVALQNPADQDRAMILKSTLHSMIGLQHNFGSAAGAPVLFYVGAFIYSDYEVHEELGDNMTSHQLAIAMLWMVIPHIAIVSCLLLSGNNPTIWEGAIAHMRHLPQPHGSRRSTFTGKRTFLARQLSLLREYAAAGGSLHYKPAWMWSRGWRKAEWIARLADECPSMELRGRVLGSRRLSKSFVSILMWSFLSALLLFCIPVFLATFVNFYTPRVGLGCRSGLFLMYGLTQPVLLLLWLVDYCFWKFPDLARKQPKPSHPELGLADYVWYFIFVLMVGCAIFSSIGGTFFILIGLLKNCLCNIPAYYWLDRSNFEARIFWNKATSEQIQKARDWWFPSGIAGTVFLVVIAFLGWWYQKSLRRRFHDLVNTIEGPSDGLGLLDQQEAGIELPFIQGLAPISLDERRPSSARKRSSEPLMVE